MRELITFTDVFGPIGVGWASEFAVEIPAAGDAGRGRAATGSVTGWHADLSNLGPGRWGVGLVRPFEAHVDWPIKRRLEQDASLFSDRLRLLHEEQQDLVNALALLEAVTGPFDPRLVQIAAMNAVHGSPTHGLPIALDRWTDWRSVNPHPSAVRGGYLFPFTPGAKLNMRRFGYLVLASLIDKQLNWALPRLSIAADQFLDVWAVGSLIELMYRQIRAHVQIRASKGAALCRSCGGVVLRTRARGRHENKKHARCEGRRSESIADNWPSRS